jgi:tRNA-binding protein
MERWCIGDERDLVERLALRVGVVTAAEDFPGARVPAYKLTVDFGPDLGTRRSSARLTHYPKDDLLGRQVVCVLGFPVKRIAGFPSEVLVLGAYSTDQGVVLLRPDGAHEDQPAWSPDGRLIAFSREGLGPQASSRWLPTAPVRLSSSTTQILRISASPPDGTEMAIVGITRARYDRTVRVLDLATGLLSPISEPGPWYGPSWQPVAAANDPTAASTSTRR